MVSMRDLARMAKVCARCHVGSPASGGLPLCDVDHDLIAAGHPLLSFEFSAYQATIPPYWVEKGINAGGDYSVRSWAVGQAVTARAALTLLEDRAVAPRLPKTEGRHPQGPNFPNSAVLPAIMTSSMNPGEETSRRTQPFWDSPGGAHGITCSCSPSRTPIGRNPRALRRSLNGSAPS